MKMKIDKWLHKMKLYEYKDKVYTLSKGNQQLALIVCLIKEPNSY